MDIEKLKNLIDWLFFKVIYSLEKMVCSDSFVHEI